MRKEHRPGDFDFSHLVDIPEPPTLPDPDRDRLRAASILALPMAQRLPNVAAKLAADPSVGLQAARDVLASIASAAATQANTKAGPFTSLMMQARGKIDDRLHVAAPRGPELTAADRHNAKMQRIEHDGLSEADRTAFAKAWQRMQQERSAAQ